MPENCVFSLRRCCADAGNCHCMASGHVNYERERQCFGEFKLREPISLELNIFWVVFFPHSAETNIICMKGFCMKRFLVN